MKPFTFRKWIFTILLLFFFLMIILLLGSLTGPEGGLLKKAWEGDERARAILLIARLPRVMMAALVGMALASSGGAFQAILENPLADPFILGISGGAALGSVIGIGLKLPFSLITLVAFFGAMGSGLVIWSMSGLKTRFESTSLLLTGVIFNAFCFAMILFINAIVTMEEAYQIIFLLIGNLEVTDPATLLPLGFFVLTGFCGLILLSPQMNLLSLGDETAKGLGIDPRQSRGLIFMAASIMVGAAIAISGLIGFVGLFIPHIIRMLFGADNRLLIPASGLLGASFLVVADAVSRTMLMHTGFATELPVGVITALIGAPMFFFLLKKRRMG